MSDNSKKRARRESSDGSSDGNSVDDRMTAGARKAGLPAGRDEVAGMLRQTRHPAALAAALVRVSLGRERPVGQPSDAGEP